MADQAPGIAHLAIVHYEKVLESIKSRMGVAEDPEVRYVSRYYNSCFPNELDSLVIRAARVRRSGGGIVLTPPQSVRQTSLAHEAAHNLMLLYAAMGSTQLAKKQSHWLAI
jgi:hypothetical protein